MTTSPENQDRVAEAIQSFADTARLSPTSRSELALIILTLVESAAPAVGQASRLAFESWYVEEHALTADMRKNLLRPGTSKRTREYEAREVQSAWKVWQASRAHMTPAGRAATLDEMDGFSVRVGGAVAAWFIDAEQASDWGTENYFGQWLMHAAKMPNRPPFTQEQLDAARQEGAAMLARFTPGRLAD